MAMNQSGVSGILGFLQGLEKGKQERRQYQDQTSQMGLQFARDTNEFNRQQRADAQQREQFQMQKDELGLRKSQAKTADDLARIQLEAATRANDPYNLGRTSRAKVLEEIAGQEALLPDLLKSYGTARTDLEKNAIAAKMNMIRRSVSRKRSNYEMELKSLKLTPEQLAELQNLDEAQQLTASSGATQQVPGMAPTPQTGLPMTGFQSQVALPSTGFNQQQPSSGFKLNAGVASPQLPSGQAPSPQLGLPQQVITPGATGLLSKQKPITGQQIPGQAPQMLPNGKIRVDSDLSTYLSGLGMNLKSGESNDLSPEDYKSLMDILKEGNLSSLVSSTDVGPIQRRAKDGLPDPTKPLPGIDYGAVTTRLMPVIRQTLRTAAKRMNRTVEEVQSGLFGDNKENWPIADDGTDATPADGGLSIKTAMIPFINVDPKVVSGWTDTRLGMEKEIATATENKAKRDFEAEENKKNRANQLAIANLGKQGAIGAAAQQAVAIQKQVLSQNMNTADEGYASAYQQVAKLTETNAPTTLEELGISKSVTKQKIPIDVARVIASTVQGEMLSRQGTHLIDPKGDPYANGYKARVSRSVVASQLRGVEAGIGYLQQKISGSTPSAGGRPNTANKADNDLLTELTAQQKSLKKVLGVE